MLTTFNQLVVDDTYVEPHAPTVADIPDEDTEIIRVDTGPLLMLRRAFLSPCNPSDDWLRNSVFQSTCTINGKVCSFIIDSGSCENVISESAITELGLPTEVHPHPYKLVWLSRGTDVLISRRALITMSIGPTYSDEIS